MLNRRSTIVAVGCPNSITYAAQSINNSISRKRDRCRRFSCMDGGMASNQTAPHTSSIHRRSVRRWCCEGARHPMILRSGAGLAARWTEVSFFDARGPDTVRLPRRCDATHCGSTQPEGIAWCAGTHQPLHPAAADGGVARSASQSN
ncbi:hypothetical protein TcCL_Unassigned03352 [Trypanosoma cruzi]|nr:hypothetical protein TcCL_Unassigned03352 [Trypanosoma cruzi]